jgi:hypothetical protein
MQHQPTAGTPTVGQTSIICSIWQVTAANTMPCVPTGFAIKIRTPQTHKQWNDDLAKVVLPRTLTTRLYPFVTGRNESTVVPSGSLAMKSATPALTYSIPFSVVTKLLASEMCSWVQISEGPGPEGPEGLGWLWGSGASSKLSCHSPSGRRHP